MHLSSEFRIASGQVVQQKGQTMDFRDYNYSECNLISKIFLEIYWSFYFLLLKIQYANLLVAGNPLTQWLRTRHLDKERWNRHHLVRPGRCAKINTAMVNLFRKPDQDRTRPLSTIPVLPVQLHVRVRVLAAPKRLVAVAVISLLVSNLDAPNGIRLILASNSTFFLFQWVWIRVPGFPSTATLPH